MVCISSLKHTHVLDTSRYKEVLGTTTNDYGVLCSFNHTTEQLIASKANIVDEIKSYEYGKFLHIEDLEGNIIELWEPVHNVFTKTEKSVMPMR